MTRLFVFSDTYNTAFVGLVVAPEWFSSVVAWTAFFIIFWYWVMCCPPLAGDGEAYSFLFVTVGTRLCTLKHLRVCDRYLLRLYIASEIVCNLINNDAGIFMASQAYLYAAWWIVKDSWQTWYGGWFPVSIGHFCIFTEHQSRRSRH